MSSETEMEFSSRDARRPLNAGDGPTSVEASRVGEWIVMLAREHQAQRSQIERLRIEINLARSDLASAEDTLGRVARALGLDSNAKPHDIENAARARADGGVATRGAGGAFRAFIGPDGLVRAIGDVFDEAAGNMSRWRPYNSAHEVYGVLVEEVAEYFDEVRAKEERRDPEKMRRELIQIAAVAVRAVAERYEFERKAAP